jgi:hypothetical protein
MSKFTEKLEWFTWDRRGTAAGVAGLAVTFVDYVWADWVSVGLISAATFCWGAAYMEQKLAPCECEDEAPAVVNVHFTGTDVDPVIARKTAQKLAEDAARYGAM